MIGILTPFGNRPTFFYGPLAVPILLGGVQAASLWYQYTSGEEASDRADDAADLAKAQAEQDAKDDLLGAKQQATDLAAQIAETQVDIAEAKTKITGYESFLGRFESYSTTKKTEKQYEGQQAFDELVNTLGYTDAVAGATGRVAAGTSMAAVGQKATKNLTDYVGEDRTLDANGGLYGMQYNELVQDLAAERGEAKANLDIWGTSLDTLEETQDLLNTSYADTQKRIGELEDYIDEQFGDE